MIQPFLDQASTYAGQIDNVILLIAVLVFFWFFVAEIVLFKFVWDYRASKSPKASYVTGKEPELKRWITIPHAIIILCDIVIIVFAGMAWYEVKMKLPEPDAEVQLISQQWSWSFVHPGADGKLGTDDDIKTVDELYIEKDKNYHYHLESKDVLHSFSVPVFRLKQDAVPGRVITGWFNATQEGESDIQCAEMCGIGHGLMMARVIVQSAEQHAAWIASHGN
jgi:cytochrome c oxidase subunit 2